MKPQTEQEILELLSEIPDPEVPAVNIVELGIIRRVELAQGVAKVFITPTYSGCPALKMIEAEVIEKLRGAGFTVSVDTVFSPPWTTAWISQETREKLRIYGIAPPLETKDDPLVVFPKPRQVPCPRCSGTRTELKSEFGATACKALYYCPACNEPFEHFKAH